ncbi:hypothetical protein JTB14_026102 [Gonioctena quinquepunctata]|nr:hypothetical protein JTB14_026102 [Gonioctena quinquepunctata]
MDEEDGIQVPVVTKSSRKRRTTGRVTEVNKKLRLQSHEEGPDYHCKRLTCFEVILPEERSEILKNFNNMNSWNEQTAYLSGLICVAPVITRRLRLPAEDGIPRAAYFHYKIRFLRGDAVTEVSVCANAFIAIHGITRRRLTTIQKSLQLNGAVSTDGSGKHTSKFRKLSEQSERKVRTHIASFKSRTSHKSKKKTNKLYLPEEINVTKMYNLYKENYSRKPVSYETYRTIFTTKFNITFGSPRLTLQFL